MSTPPDHGELVQAHLLELAGAAGRQAQEHFQEASPELVAYRHWYLGQVVGQLEGQPPCPGRGTQPRRPEGRRAWWRVTCRRRS